MAEILIVAAHPDDEVLGMGGTIARLVKGGHQVQALFLSDGVGARGSGITAVQQRQACAQGAAERLGHRIAAFLTFPDNRFDNVPLLDLVHAIEKVKLRQPPALVFTHHAGDLNIDHRRTAEAVLTAFRPQPGESCRGIWSFAVASSSEWSHPSATAPFLPDTFVDITEQLPALEEAWDCYSDEQRPDPHARSRQALRLRVEHCGRTVGMAAAEPFMTLRRIHPCGPLAW
jgi:LmbE family N-acetylglucosaminyl deacetylase